MISTTGGGLGGAENIAIAIAEEARARRWPQLVLNPFAITRRGLADFEGGECEVFHCPRKGDVPRARSWVGRRLREFGPDIVHAHMLHAEITVASLRLPPSARSVLGHEHGPHLVSQGRRWAAKVDRLAGLRYDRVVACCQSVGRFLVDEYRYRPDKVVCIDNGWSGTPPRDVAKAPDPTIVCVANLRPQKGHPVLIDAFAKVRERVPAARLTLVGIGPWDWESGLRERVRQRGLDGSVEFAGTTTDVWPQLARAHVFALASHYEGGRPLAVLEAMAAGVPVVGAAVYGIVDSVEPGVSGLLVPPDEPEALADQIVALLEDPELRERLASGARRFAESARMEVCVARYFELYEELAGTAARG